MIETLCIFVLGILAGVILVIAVKELYDWIAGLTNKVQTLKNELYFYRMQREQWYEFNDWKRMQKGKE